MAKPQELQNDKGIVVFYHLATKKTGAFACNEVWHSHNVGTERL